MLLGNYCGSFPTSAALIGHNYTQMYMFHLPTLINLENVFLGYMPHFCIHQLLVLLK